MANPKGKPGRSAFTAERLARALLLICAVVAIFAVCAITLYLFAKGLPALHKVGVGELLFGTVWKPTAAEPSFGIAYIILSSIVGTAASVLLGVPIGLLTARPWQRWCSPPWSCWRPSPPSFTACWA